jgi:hypothetical protein
MLLVNPTKAVTTVHSIVPLYISIWEMSDLERFSALLGGLHSISSCDRSVAVSGGISFSFCVNVTRDGCHYSTF